MLRCVIYYINLITPRNVSPTQTSHKLQWYNYVSLYNSPKHTQYNLHFATSNYIKQNLMTQCDPVRRICYELIPITHKTKSWFVFILKAAILQISASHHPQVPYTLLWKLSKFIQTKDVKLYNKIWTLKKQHTSLWLHIKHVTTCSC